MLAVSAAALAVTAHAAAGGGVPDVSLTLLLTVLIGWVATSLAGRTRGLPGILAVLGAAQLIMHLVLTELMGHSGHSGLGVPPAGLMTLAHVLATAGTALLLAHAERMLLAVAAGLRLLLPVLWRHAPVPHGPARALPGVPDAAPGHLEMSVLLRRVCARRGPPACS
ncbi:hypothetical protein [Amycolatopsis nigrescens]|uniref:hypothetical protein n=1 Tax=Amycolatopsis nigrescens TaxID=381445 RepID=UPI000360F06D|nr:hypothetical protein [Amycolatopsis nigrescens]